MAQKGDPGCLKSVGFVIVVIIGAIFIAAIFDGVGKVLFSIPWFIWPILLLAVLIIIGRWNK